MNNDCYLVTGIVLEVSKTFIRMDIDGKIRKFPLKFIQLVADEDQTIVEDQLFCIEVPLWLISTLSIPILNGACIPIDY